MQKTNEELLAELAELKRKNEELEKKFSEKQLDYENQLDELRMKLMFLDGVANSTFDGFLVVNPYGQKILQNQRTIELWKIPQEIVDDPDGMKQVNHVMHMTVHPEQFVADIDYLRDHPNDKSRDELELIDGTVLDRYSSPVIGPDGINYGRIWTFHDITDRKKFEKQLIQLNTDKDRFISILAHDLRSPFNNLLGFSQLLKRNFDEYSKDKVEKMVDIIYTTAKKAHELLEDTLTWASIQTKQIAFTLEDINLNEVTAEVIDILDSIAKNKKINVINSVPENTMVTCDVFMIKTILRNLVSNAIKFTSRGGKIELSCSFKDSLITIKVSDNGAGMKKEVKDKLFNFSSLTSTKGTEGESGTGLGLMLCKEFVKKHNGKIWIDSIENKGTSVNFTLPAAS